MHRRSSQLKMQLMQLWKESLKKEIQACQNSNPEVHTTSAAL